jgi:hypothetical protein
MPICLEGTGYRLGVNHFANLILRIAGQPQTSLTVQGAGIEDLIQGVMERPLVLAPPLPAIAQWVEDMRAKGEQGRLTLYINNGRLSK